MVKSIAPSISACFITGFVYPDLLMKYKCFSLIFGNAFVAVNKSTYSSYGTSLEVNLHSTNIALVPDLSIANKSTSSCALRTGLFLHYLPI